MDRRAVISGWTDLALGALSLILIIVFGLIMLHTSTEVSKNTVRGGIDWEASYLAGALANHVYSDSTFGEALAAGRVDAESGSGFIKHILDAYEAPDTREPMVALVVNDRLVTCEDRGDYAGSCRYPFNGRALQIPLEEWSTSGEDLDALLRALTGIKGDDLVSWHALTDDTAIIVALGAR